MRKTKEEAEKTRRAILDAALQEFSLNGYNRTRLEDVAHRAGVTRGAIYWHFDNKQMLYTTLVRECHEEVEQRFFQAIHDGDSAETWIRTLAEILVQTMETNSRFRAVHEVTLFKTEFSEDVQHVLEEQREMTHHFVGVSRKLIQKGIDCGELIPSLDADRMAWALINLLQGVFLSWLWDPDAFELRPAVLDLIAMYLHFVKKP